MQERSVAILIDGGFFLKRLRHLLPSATTPELQVAAIMRLCKSHLAQLAGLPMSGKQCLANLILKTCCVLLTAFFIMTRSPMKAKHIMLLAI
jgi:hypothetical protein